MHPTWLSQNPTKINSFWNQSFHTLFCIHLWQFPTDISQKPWLHLFTNFATKAQKVNPPNLAKPKPNQDQFLLQPKFWHLIFYASVKIPHQRLHKNRNFTYSPILLPRQKKADPPNLAKPTPHQDQFLLQPNFSHLIFDAFVTFPHQDCTKTITSLIHQFCYQGKKSRSTELG